MGEAEAVQTDEKHSDSGISPAEDSVVWSQEVEVCLFHAMLGHKPVGVNRHFHMICIRDKFSQNIGRQVSSKVIWDHLGTMYDMQALHESEILPFPNSEKTFVLPEEIIQEVKEGKVGTEEEAKEDAKEERDTSAVQEEGLGPSLAGQEFERYGQKSTFTLFQNSNMTAVRVSSKGKMVSDGLVMGDTSFGIKTSSSSSSAKTTEKGSSKDKEKDRERASGESSAKDAADKRKRNRATEKVLSSSSNPASPGGTKRRRT